MHLQIGDRILIIFSLIAANAGFFTLLFYRPKDLLPHTYDALKWIAAVSGMIGVFILASYATAICCFILFLAYPLAYKHCYTTQNLHCRAVTRGFRLLYASLPS